MLRRSLLAALALTASPLVIVPALGAPAPSLKPDAPASPYVSAGDEAVLRQMLEALEDERYAVADALRAEVTDRFAQSFADWLYYRSGAKRVPPEEYAAFLDAHSGWPQSITIQTKAEENLGGARPGRIIAFHEDRPPVSGEGMLQLTRALLPSNQGAAEAILREAWVTRNWSAKEEQSILSEFGASLREADHAAKADRQLFDIRATATERLLPLLAPAERAKAEARIALLKGERNAPALYEGLPKAAKRDAGVLHAATRYHRRKDEDAAATYYAGLVPLSGTEMRNPERWLRERMLLARTAIKEGRNRNAYVLSAYSGLEDGADFADAEFMAGWVALRFLQEPETAQAHFAYLLTGVTSPISLARGHYWLGRAQAAAGEQGAANASYAAAADYPYTFYGQLAAEALGETGPNFPAPQEPDANAILAFEGRSMTRAARIAADVGADWAFERLARALDDELADPGEVRAYADLVLAERKPHLAVRAGKVARGNGAKVPEVIYPMIAVPPEAAQYTELGLVLGLARQESEFNPRAYSPARAYGLMQMIDGTARATARKEGLPYKRAWLLDDPQYNLKLGAAHLSHLIERFDGSYVMTLAAYNAGPHRVDEWVETYGDPRDPFTDPIDWIELIPFSETRNYVMRVLENTQVYRARLEDRPIAGLLTRDILRGGAKAEAIGGPVPSPTLVRVTDEAPANDVLRRPKAEPRAMSVTLAMAPANPDVAVPSVKPGGN